MEQVKEIIKEVTGTVDCGKGETFTYPEHTYYLNENGKMVGFKSAFTNEMKWFTKPMAFYKSKRKFVKVKNG